MKVTAADFKSQYADLSDEALLDIDRQDLVDLARKCYDEELARRKLKAPAPAAAVRFAPRRAVEPVAKRAAEPEEEPVAEPATEPPAESEDLVVAETYDSPEAARLARELLRTSGIRAVLDDDGLAVLVPASAESAAQAVLIAEISDETLAQGATGDPSYVRDGWSSARPYLYGDAGLREFVIDVFRVAERGRVELGPDSVRVDVYVAVLELSDSPPADATTGSVYVYVRNVDATYARALKSGAESIAPPEDQPYDERTAAVLDAYGNTWRIATYTANP